MANTNSRDGFTLVEAMIALSIGALVLGQLGFALVGGVRMIRDIMTQNDLMVGTRLVREKVLFNLTPQSDIGLWNYGGTVHGKIVRISPGGILNGYGVQTTGSMISMNLTNIETAVSGSGSASTTLKLIQENDVFRVDGLNYVQQADGTWGPHPWVRPAGLTLVNPDSVIDGSERTTKNRVYINLIYQENGFQRAERICFPLFGTVQPKEEVGL